MNQSMQAPAKGWTAKRKTELAFDIIQGRITIPEASRSHDLTTSEIEGWIEDGGKAFENVMRSRPLDTPQQNSKVERLIRADSAKSLQWNPKGLGQTFEHQRYYPIDK